MKVKQYYWTKTKDANNYLIPFTHYIDKSNNLVRTPLKWYGAKDVAEIDSTLKPGDEITNFDNFKIICTVKPI